MARLPFNMPLLSVVVPTYNRPQFLARVLTYYAGLRFPYTIIVADSSAEPTAKANRQLANTLRHNLNLNYQYYAEDIHVADKITRALTLVSSPYVALGADDDFTVPASLKPGAEFLESHPDYAVVHGEAVYFVLRPGAYAHGAITGVGRYAQRTIEWSTGSERLIDHLTRYTTTFYSVHRTEQLRNNWQCAARLRLDYSFVELLPACLSLIQGKSKQLGGLHIVRQGHAGQTSRTKLPSVMDWIVDSAWFPQYSSIQDLLAKALTQQDGITEEQARLAVKQAFMRYLTDQVVAAEREQRGRQMMRLRLRESARRIPGLKKAWRAVRFLMPVRRNTVSLEAFLRRTSVFYGDFMPIYRAVTGVNDGG